MNVRIDEKVKAYNDRGKKEYTKPIEEIIQEQADKMRSVHTQELYDANKLDNPERREKMTMLRDKHDVEMKQFHHDSNAKLYSHYNDEKYKNNNIVTTYGVNVFILISNIKNISDAL